MDARSTVAEPVQRWRITYRRDPVATLPGSADLPGSPDREAIWQAALLGSGLPVAVDGTQRRRPRIVHGPPLGRGLSGEGELVDVVLTQRLSAADFRARLVAAVPAGHRLVALEDVWLGAPSLSADIVAADHRIEFGAEAPVSEIASAAAALLTAGTIPFARQRGGTGVPIDLRPFLASIAATAGPPPALHFRTRFDPKRGTARPDEVLGALERRLGYAVPVVEVVRERLSLRSDGIRVGD